ncbi:Calmodulin-dependent protein kinase cmk2 [Gurleya vavrai]
MEKFNIIIKPRLKIILNDVLHALQYLHSKSLCFFDLKDENLMLKFENDKLVCKLIDFESLFYGNNYNEENLAFTKYYIPVDTDLSTINDKHDIYCLGMLTYLLITGTRLLENPENFSFRVFETKKNPIRFVNRLAINEELKDFIISCLDKIPNARPSAIDLLKHKFFLS